VSALGGVADALAQPAFGVMLSSATLVVLGARVVLEAMDPAARRHHRALQILTYALCVVFLVVIVVRFAVFA
jgi:hypothetical protein